MTTEDFIPELFCRIDDDMEGIEKHTQANLYASEVVTIAILFALKGVGNRAFYRWMMRDCQGMFPKLPVRTRLFRLFNTHRQHTQLLLADPTIIGLTATMVSNSFIPDGKDVARNKSAKKGCRINVGL